MDFIEVQVMQLAIWFIRRGYGADCPDYSEGCKSCQAKEAVEFLEYTINLIKN
jgi:hypothetical protein